jgi:salicylate hydroxylase
LPYQGQGAAMAVEDAAVLGTLLAKTQQAETKATTEQERKKAVASALQCYQRLRKDRAELNVAGAVHTRHFYHLSDGEEQENRDRELAAEASHEWKAPCIFNWADAEYQRDLLGFDVLRDAEVASEKWSERASML